MLILQNISYKHNNSDVLFDNISFTINNHEKIALIGHNGVGKSTLLKIIVGDLQPSTGELKTDSAPYYIPQIFGQYNHFTIGEALRVNHKLNALAAILNGDVTEEYLTILNDDWTIEERCNNALKYWDLNGLDLTQKIETLSGGQKTKVFLAGILIHEPELVLLDEPSNHLDKAARELLYHFILTANCSLIVVSHDRKLLGLLSIIYEMSKRGITVYGGNYDFYTEQKEIENNALNQDLQSMEKALRRAREKERETIERQQKLDARGKKKQEKSGVARIMMNSLRNNAENSSSKLKSVHGEKVNGISRELHELRSALPDIDQMKLSYNHSALHKGKILFKADAINYAYEDQLLWIRDLNIEIISGERITIQGSNGAGKTTLIEIILGKIKPVNGTVYIADNLSVYIDQDYSLINNQLNVYEQAQVFNVSGLEEHEIKMRLNRFLFHKEYWDKSCNVLSGGEKMRLMLCCLAINNESRDIIILDEPTNNLDLQNVEILIAAINEYKGTLIVVSHDESFLEQINIEKIILLE
jgi:ATPase subunit of ABC transporter with duplicated ATPase domains